MASNISITPVVYRRKEIKAHINPLSYSILVLLPSPARDSQPCPSVESTLHGPLDGTA